jgi:hypothetical protein
LFVTARPGSTIGRVSTTSPQSCGNNWLTHPRCEHWDILHDAHRRQRHEVHHRNLVPPRDDRRFALDLGDAVDHALAQELFVQTIASGLDLLAEEI